MLIFTPIALIFPQYMEWISSLDVNGSVKVAIAHIIFKVVTALVMLPFVSVVVKLSEKIVKNKEHETRLRFEFIDTKQIEKFYGSAEISKFVLIRQED